jgi:hypothetical protein
MDFSALAYDFSFFAFSFSEFGVFEVSSSSFSKDVLNLLFSYSEVRSESRLILFFSKLSLALAL